MEVYGDHSFPLAYTAIEVPSPLRPNPSLLHTGHADGLKPPNSFPSLGLRFGELLRVFHTTLSTGDPVSCDGYTGANVFLDVRHYIKSWQWLIGWKNK